MTQEIIVGIILGIIGLCLVFVPIDLLWNTIEKWKANGNSEPSKAYAVVVRTIGAVMALIGILVALFA